MIISHKHKFIFMHSRKCAGSSMEVMLNKHLGPNDIQIGSWPETILAGGSMNNRLSDRARRVDTKDLAVFPLYRGINDLR